MSDTRVRTAGEGRQAKAWLAAAGALLIAALLGALMGILMPTPLYGAVAQEAGGAIFSLNIGLVIWTWVLFL
ncbi:unnamed protein product, partial [marine sediment metagenome]